MLDAIELSRLINYDEVSKPYFEGVFAYDQFLSDTSRKKDKRNLIFVVNTDPSWKNGTHWLLVFVKGNKVFFVDSLGFPPSHYGLEKKLQSFGRQIIHIDNINLQCQFSTACGAYCIYFSYHLSRGKSFEHILKMFRRFSPDYNDMLVVEFCREQNERMLA